MTGRKNRRVNLIPKRPDDMDPIIRWGIRTHLHLIEEVACGSETSGTGAPDMEEAAERIVESLGTDWKANEEAAVDRMRAEVTTWWQDFAERQLLTDLYRRAARRKAKCGSADSGRKPSHSEGLRVARGLLAHIPDTGPLDFAWEYAAVSTVLAALLLPPIGIRSRAALRAYIKLSIRSRVFYDALLRICVELDKRGEAISPMLAKWRREVVGGQRLRPARKARPRRRPVKPDDVRRDLRIQLTIEILRRIGVPPRGKVVSGCRIVTEALKPSEDDKGLSEDTVVRIWNGRIWEKPFKPVMQKQSADITKRTGLPRLYVTRSERH